MEGVEAGVQQREVQLGLAKDKEELRSLEVMANEVRKRMEIGEVKALRVPPGVKDPQVKQEKEMEVVMVFQG